jgi:hypothetical protein
MVEKIEENKKAEKKSDTKSLILQATGKFIFLFILLGLCYFLTADTILFWEAWLFIGLFFL